MQPQVPLRTGCVTEITPGEGTGIRARLWLALARGHGRYTTTVTPERALVFVFVGKWPLI
jgi:hypothetical protein